MCCRVCVVPHLVKPFSFYRAQARAAVTHEPASSGASKRSLQCRRVAASAKPSCARSRRRRHLTKVVCFSTQSTFTCIFEFLLYKHSFVCERLQLIAPTSTSASQVPMYLFRRAFLTSYPLAIYYCSSLSSTVLPVRGESTASETVLPSD